jgi:hypothetical protein
MTLRHLLAIAIVTLVSGACLGEQCYAQTTNFGADGGGQVSGLQDQLEKGLKCRRPQEFEFVDAVVAKVEHGDLSRQIVVETFAFARKRAAKYGTKYAFPYFQRGLEERANKAGTPLNIDTTNLFPQTR